MNVTRNGSVNVVTKQGTVTIRSEAVEVPRTIRRLLGKYEKRRSLLRTTLVIVKGDVHEVSVSGHDRQYLTGSRAAGAVLTGGAALLAPSRMRGSLVIATRAGDILEFTLLRQDARHPEAIAAAFSARGYVVR
jgi:hypothetical protein